jgi:hypothetical protein
MKKKRTRKTVRPLAQDQWWNKLYSTLSCINSQREMEFDGVEVSFDDACPSFGGTDYSRYDFDRDEPECHDMYDGCDADDWHD